MQQVPGLARLLSDQSGLARRDQLAGLGVTAQHVAEQCAAGRWRAVSPIVVAADNGRLDEEQLLWLAVLNAGRGWIGGRTALARRGLTGGPVLAHRELLVPRGARPPRLPGVRLHVTAREPAPSGPLLTSVARATVDASAWERWPRAATGLVLAVIQQRLATVDEIAGELAAAGRVRHRAVVRDALDEAARGADALSEVDVDTLIRRAGLPAPRRQVRDGSGRLDLEVDLPDGRLLKIEVDGPQHDTGEARWIDARRDAQRSSDGDAVLRIPVFAVRYDPTGIVRELVRIRLTAEQNARRRTA